MEERKNSTCLGGESRINKSEWMNQEKGGKKAPAVEGQLMGREDQRRLTVPAAGERLGWGAIFSQLMIWVTAVAGQSQHKCDRPLGKLRGPQMCPGPSLWNMVRLVWAFCNLFPFVRIKSHSSGYTGIGQGTLLQASSQSFVFFP